jgi:hypothetical protein
MNMHINSVPTSNSSLISINIQFKLFIVLIAGGGEAPATHKLDPATNGLNRWQGAPVAAEIDAGNV